MVNSYDDMAGEMEDVSDHKFSSSDTKMAGDVVRMPITMETLSNAIRGQTLNSLAKQDRSFPTDKTNVTPIKSK